ncbi:MAG: hypothetical protein DSM106950_45035 [Stigonema ocellatum SAG 48.90 = DSM 106950]|nr:hypothetical protein [Stigonema ocellatum SAG 48.90 = DSM 106950]
MKVALSFILVSVLFLTGCKSDQTTPTADPAYIAEQTALQAIPFGCQPLTSAFTLKGTFNGQPVCLAGDSLKADSSRFVSGTVKVGNGANLKYFASYIDQFKPAPAGLLAIHTTSIDTSVTLTNYLRQPGLLNTNLPIAYAAPTPNSGFPYYGIEFQLPVTIKTAAGEQQGRITYTSTNIHQPTSSYLRLTQVKSLANGYALTYRFSVRLYSGSYPESLWLDISDAELTCFAPTNLK